MKPHLCKQCGDDNSENFYTSQKSTCKKCYIARSIKRATPVHSTKSVKSHRCNRCGVDNPMMFYPSNKSKCKKCCSAYGMNRVQSLSPLDMTRLKEKVAAWQDNNILVYRWKSAMHRAKRKNREFTITEQDIKLIWEKQQGLCYYTKQPMKLSRDDNRYSVSLDRLDSSVGYIPGNVVLCCAAVNLMKNDLSVTEFTELVGLIHANIG